MEYECVFAEKPFIKNGENMRLFNIGPQFKRKSSKSKKKSESKKKVKHRVTGQCKGCKKIYIFLYMY